VKQRDRLKVAVQHDRFPDERFELDDSENDDSVVVMTTTMMIKIWLFSRN
jgi:hypothetical protein